MLGMVLQASWETAQQLQPDWELLGSFLNLVPLLYRASQLVLSDCDRKLLSNAPASSPTDCALRPLLPILC